MKNVLIALIVLALAIPAVAGQNPWRRDLPYTTSTGIAAARTGRRRRRPVRTPDVYVCFDHFGVGGGMLAAEFMI